MIERDIFTEYMAESKNKNIVEIGSALQNTEKENPYITCIQGVDCHVLYSNELNICLCNFRDNEEQFITNEIYVYLENDDKGYHNKIAVKKEYHGFIHRHDFYELIYVVKGVMKQTLMDDTIFLKQSDILIINPDVIHSEIVENADILYIQMKGTELQEILSDSCISHKMKAFFEQKSKERKMEYLHFVSEDPCSISNLMGLILKERIKRQAGSRLLVRGLLARILKELDSGKSYYIRQESRKLSENVRVLKNLEQYLEERCWNVEIQELSTFFHYNEAYLGQLVKKSTGMTLRRYCIEHRLEYARQLLVNTDLSVNEIIRKIGYQNKTYFYKIFKQRYGITPSEYKYNIQIGYY